MKPLVIVKGAGDIASGIIYKLNKCGFKVLALEIEKPTTIRRYVSFSSSVYLGESFVEDTKAIYIDSVDKIDYTDSNVYVLTYSDINIIKNLNCIAFIDATLCKKDTGTTIDLAPIVIGVGPSFTAQKNCHAVIETMRGHDLGRVLYEGSAISNTGIPGDIGGYTTERVIYAEHSGTLKIVKDIESLVKKGDIIATIDNQNVLATINGIVRGMIPNDFVVKKGLKIADIDPRESEKENCFKISDKARCIAGGVLEAILFLERC